MNKTNRKERLNSPEYREQIGERLKQKRIELDFSISDIAYMTTIPDNTILTIEKGITTNIDYYVEYAKAVQYPMETLTDFNIELIPINILPFERKEKVNLTSKIRKLIIQSDFLKSGKTVIEIKDELIDKQLVDNDKTTSTEIAGVMRNFVNDGFVKIEKKYGRKNVYIKI
ncbi:RodZ family helix-turn-helix domain-containing protein [Elizabethkingia sp. M8]|uniref:helix-turn-helix domain-containing protein n=1 Tax=Elizabethkingia sp. M8 TaxID=2796140 RepID=UPI001903F439|nr:hypothetical protein [Elizabethkingia sp. M8]QQM25357.1 hypothetical protein JCR23_10615 [Elizabethkingia sp. M8]